MSIRGVKVESNVVVNIGVFREGSIFPEGWKADGPGAVMGAMDNSDGTFTPPVIIADPPTHEDSRDNRLNSIIYDFGDGRTTRIVEPRIRNSIERMARTGAASIRWNFMEGVALITSDELQDALDYYQDETESAWDIYYDDINP